MSSSERNDFPRDITTSIMAYTLYPTKLEREHVAFLVIKKYPFLADRLGSGIVSTSIYLSTIYLSTLHTRYQSPLTKFPWIMKQALTLIWYVIVRYWWKSLPSSFGLGRFMLSPMSQTTALKAFIIYLRQLLPAVKCHNDYIIIVL